MELALGLAWIDNPTPAACCLLSLSKAFRVGGAGYREDEDGAAARRPALGPAVPDWVRRQQDADAAPAVLPPRPRLTGASADFAAAETALAAAAAAKKARKKEKKRKRKAEKAAKEGKVQKRKNRRSD